MHAPAVVQNHNPWYQLIFLLISAINLFLFEIKFAVGFPCGHYLCDQDNGDSGMTDFVKIFTLWLSCNVEVHLITI